MVQRDYTINKLLTMELIQEITAQPNFLNVISSGDSSSATFSFDHTQRQSTEFLKYLNTKLGLYGVVLSKYVNRDGGALIYTTDTPVILTNVGTTFKNLYPRSDGMSFGFDTDMFDQVRLVVHWTRLGTGIHSIQIIEKGAPANVLATLEIPATGGTSPYIGQWTPIPDVLKETTNLYIIQVKSTVAADDPTFEGIRVYAK